MNKIIAYFCLLVLFIVGCKSNNKGTEKFQKHRDNIVNVEERIRDIKTDVLLGSIVVLDIIEDYLIVTDIQSVDKGIHLYNKNTFEYITSTGILGRGPGEITRIGPVSIDNKNKIIWAGDYGREAIYEFPLDSIIRNPKYKPTKEINFNKDYFFGGSLDFLNDSMAIGKALQLINEGEFIMMMAKLNINNSQAEPYGYMHPEATGPRSHFVSNLTMENELYVNCYERVDLMTICDLEGNLKYNIYGGGDWFNKDKKKSYFEHVDFYNHYILASYNGGDRLKHEENNKPEVNAPTKILVFDLEGNYQKTIDTGDPISAFCVDKENKRIIAYFENRQNPLGYFALDFD